MSTFVSLGNSKNSMRRLVDAVDLLAAHNGIPLPVVVQSGHTTGEWQSIDVRPFLPMASYEQAIEDAGLVIMQAGGGGVLLAIRAGKVPVLVPRCAAENEVIDDHQIDNARNLERTGKVVVAYQIAELPAAIANALERQACWSRDTIASELLSSISADFAYYYHSR
jgi:UDP-N-acetylglucosamine transferase subunit ALG13